MQRMTSSAKVPAVEDNYEGIEPYRIHVPTKYLELTTQKFDLARLPADFELPEGQEWSEGTPKNVIEELIDHWQENYSWRREEAKLNQIPQFRTKIAVAEGHDDLRLHFVWRRSTRANAQPLLLCHGWPGSFYEYSKVIDLLAEPEGEDTQAFHIVCPSLPGYVFSDAPKKPGVGLKVYADMYDRLMKKLGYTRYYAQGGDWGYSVCRLLAIYHPDSVAGIHVNNLLLAPPTFFKHPLRFLSMVTGVISGGKFPGGISKSEAETLKAMEEYFRQEMGYLSIMSTKPNTLSYGLTDSPVGLLGWLMEKLHDWSDDYEWNNTDILTWFMLYWLPGPHGTARTYKESTLSETDILEVRSRKSSVPLGVSVFKKDLTLLLPPASWSSMVQPLKFLRRHPSGGHFAAWEKPDLLVKDLQDFLTPLIKANPPPAPAPDTPAGRPERPRPTNNLSSSSQIPTLNNPRAIPLPQQFFVSPLATPNPHPHDVHELSASTPPQTSTLQTENLSPNLAPPVTVPVTQPSNTGANQTTLNSSSNVSGVSSLAASKAGLNSEGTSSRILLPNSPTPVAIPNPNKQPETEIGTSVSSLAAAAGLVGGESTTQVETQEATAPQNGVREEIAEAKKEEEIATSSK